MPTLVSDKKKPATRNGRPAPELIFGDLWEYDPAPETRGGSEAESRASDLFIATANSWRRSPGNISDSINPGNEQKLAEIALANAPPMWMPPTKPRSAPTITCGASCPAASGPNIFSASPACCRIARGNLPLPRRWMAASRSRSRAILMCRCGRGALFLSCRVGRQARLRGAGSPRRAAGRGRTGHPVEFSAADARLENRPRARDGQLRGPVARRDHFHHGGIQAGGDHPGRRPLPAGRGELSSRACGRDAGAALMVRHPIPAERWRSPMLDLEVGKIIMRASLAAARR